MKYLLFVLAAILLYFPAQAARDESFSIVYTASLNGNIDGCGCKSNPRAGLVKLAVWLRVNAGPADAVLVDGGDALEAFPDDLLAEAILTAYGDLGYRAVAVGERELSNGLDSLRSYRERFPLVSHNLELAAGGGKYEPFSPETLIVSVRGRRVGILSLTEPAVLAGGPAELKGKMRASDPVKTGAPLVKALRDRGAELVLALYHGTYDSASRLCRQIEGIDVLVLGHEERLVDAEKIGNILVVSPGEEGNRIGVLTVTAGPGGEFSYTNRFEEFLWKRDPDDPAVRKLIVEYRAKLMNKLKEGS